MEKWNFSKRHIVRNDLEKIKWQLTICKKHLSFIYLQQVPEYQNSLNMF